MSAVDCGGERVHYEVLGRGRAVILLHGWIGSWRYWIPTMQSLQVKYRVYALDLLGFGDSARAIARYTLEHQIAMLDDFMHALGIPKAALLGHGFGALLAAEFTRRYSERVPRLLLSSAPLYNPGDLEHRVPAVRRVAAAAPAAVLPPPVDGVDSSLQAPTVQSRSAAMRAAMAEYERSRMPTRTQTNEILRGLLPNAASTDENPLLRLVNEHPLEALLARCFKRAEPNYEKLHVDVERADPKAVTTAAQLFDPGTLLDTLRLLEMPTVVVHGTDDQVFPNPDPEVWHYVTFDKEHMLVPVILPGVRHFPMLEDERFLRLVNDFLDAPDVSKLEIKERFRRPTR